MIRIVVRRKKTGRVIQSAENRLHILPPQSHIQCQAMIDGPVILDVSLNLSKAGLNLLNVTAFLICSEFALQFIRERAKPKVAVDCRDGRLILATSPSVEPCL